LTFFFFLFGLQVHDLETQCKRAYAQLHKQPTVLLKQSVFIHLCLAEEREGRDKRKSTSRAHRFSFFSFSYSAFLASLRDQNQVLFYRLMSDHLKELLGVLYTPGAAEVSFKRGKGGD